MKNDAYMVLGLVGKCRGGASASCYRCDRTDHCFCKTLEGERIADNMELRNREAVRSRAFLKASEARQSSWVSCLYMAQRLQVPETSAYFCPSL